MRAWSWSPTAPIEAAERLERVLTTDPGIGVLRHVDAGYEEALAAAAAARARAADAAVHRRVTRRSAQDGSRRLLVRDLAQLATPPGAGAPLRGRALGEVEVLEDALRPGARARPSRPSGGCASCGRARGRHRRRSTAAACARSRAWSTAIRTPASLGDRVEEFALRAAGATLRGAARRGRRDPLHRAGDARRRRGRAARGRRAPPRLDAARRHDHVGGEVGLRARPRDRARVAAGDPRRGRDPDLARRARRAAGVRGRRRPTSASRWRRCCPQAAKIAEAADVFVERGAFGRRRGAQVPRSCARGWARAPPARRPVHRARRDPARDRARRALRRSPRGDRRRRRPGARRERRRRRPVTRERALPRARRCRRRERSSTPGPRSRWRPTSTPAARSARASRSSARSRARSSGWPRRRRWRLHGQCCPCARPPGLDRPPRARLPGRPRAARRARLAPPRVPPRRRPRHAVVRGGERRQRYPR